MILTSSFIPRNSLITSFPLDTFMHGGQIKALIKFFAFWKFIQFFSWILYSKNYFFACLGLTEPSYNNIELIIYSIISRERVAFGKKISLKCSDLAFQRYHNFLFGICMESYFKTVDWVFLLKFKNCTIPWLLLWWVIQKSIISRWSRIILNAWKSQPIRSEN